MTSEATELLEELRRDEPVWCLHIRFADGSNPIFYRKLTMAELIRELSSWNRNYKLWPEQMGEKRITQNFMWILAEERRKHADLV